MRSAVKPPVVIAIVAVVALFAVAVFAILPAQSQSHPPVFIPPENRPRFARVAVLIDGTASMGEANFATAKEIVRRNLLPNLGPGDMALGYDVQPGFGTQRNEVFGFEDRMPLDSPSRRASIVALLGRNRESARTGVVEDAVYDLIRDLAQHRRQVEQVRQAWADRVRARKLPDPGGSDICHPLGDLGAFLAGGDPASERWLFLLTDLRHESQAGHRSRVCPGGQPIPAGTHILLIHFHNPDDPDGAQHQKIWRDTFRDQNPKWISFSAALTDPALLPPNPTAGLERIDVPTFGDAIRPRLVPALLMWTALTGLLSWGALTLLRLAGAEQNPRESSYGQLSGPGEPS